MITLWRALAACALLFALSPAAAHAAPPALFGTVEFRAASLADLPQWERALDEIDRERPAYRSCRRDSSACPSPGARAWLAMIEKQRDRPRADQLDVVNKFLNKWQYRTDVRNYGRRDYWATPLEFLRRSGDCEDYAITKYVSLRELGFDADQLRVVVVKDTVRDIAHAVLAVYLEDEVYILDNLAGDVLPQARVTRYLPYYSTNETSRWAHVSPLDRTALRATEPPAPTSRRQATDPAPPSW